MRRCVTGLVGLFIAALLIVHILLKVCDHVNERRGAVIRRAVYVGDNDDQSLIACWPGKAEGKRQLPTSACV